LGREFGHCKPKLLFIERITSEFATQKALPFGEGWEGLTKTKKWKK